MKIVVRKEKSLFDKESALRLNLKKRKRFKQKYKERKNNERTVR
tara:strand:- start:355 stop:486 length:132 start_codon:yes stop_codon:yes gene_type:complete